jgi:hypothetical protein
MPTMEKASTRYVVTARLAILPDETQGQIYVYQGDLLPTSTAVETIAHLLESHIISPTA